MNYPTKEQSMFSHMFLIANLLDSISDHLRDSEMEDEELRKWIDFSQKSVYMSIVQMRKAFDESQESKSVCY